MYNQKMIIAAGLSLGVICAVIASMTPILYDPPQAPALIEWRPYGPLEESEYRQLMGPYGIIMKLTIYQDPGTGYVTRGSISSDGGSLTVQPDQDTKFRVRVLLDRSKASTTTQAKDRTRCYLAITGEVSTTLMTAFAGYDLGAEIGWAAEHDYTWNVAGKPVAGNTYTVTIEYQAYY